LSTEALAKVDLLLIAPKQAFGPNAHLPFQRDRRQGQFTYLETAVGVRRNLPVAYCLLPVENKSINPQAAC
jgi:hypothetical protein